MKDGIKEILYKLEDISYNYKANFLELHYKDVKLLLDYITNLQEENQKFKNWINVLNKNNHTYKSRNEKAIEIFKNAFDYRDNMSVNNWEYDGGEEEYIEMLESIYNILQGSDKDE